MCRYRVSIDIPHGRSVVPFRDSRLVDRSRRFLPCGNLSIGSGLPKDRLTYLALPTEGFDYVAEHTEHSWVDAHRYESPAIFTDPDGSTTIDLRHWHLSTIV